MGAIDEEVAFDQGADTQHLMPGLKADGDSDVAAVAEVVTMNMRILARAVQQGVERDAAIAPATKLVVVDDDVGGTVDRSSSARAGKGAIAEAAIVAIDNDPRIVEAKAGNMDVDAAQQQVFGTYRGAEMVLGDDADRSRAAAVTANLESPGLLIGPVTQHDGGAGARIGQGAIEVG